MVQVVVVVVVVVCKSDMTILATSTSAAKYGRQPAFGRIILIFSLIPLWTDYEGVCLAFKIVPCFVIAFHFSAIAVAVVNVIVGRVITTEFKFSKTLLFQRG